MKKCKRWLFTLENMKISRPGSVWIDCKRAPSMSWLISANSCTFMTPWYDVLLNAHWQNNYMENSKILKSKKNGSSIVTRKNVKKTIFSKSWSYVAVTFLSIYLQCSQVAVRRVLCATHLKAAKCNNSKYEVIPSHHHGHHYQLVS